MHHIQKYILKKLTLTKRARFSEMRPPRTDSNVYSYHLSALQHDSFIKKNDKSYDLTPKGLAYVERISVDSFEPRMQPKIITIMIVQNADGMILLWPKSKQPFIGTWSLLSGKVHLDDASILGAVQRECIEKFTVEPNFIDHKGDSYIRAYVDSQLVSTVLAHICRVRISDDAKFHENVRWYTPEEILNLDTAPATTNIISQALATNSFYFAEYNIYVNQRKNGRTEATSLAR